VFKASPITALAVVAVLAGLAPAEAAPPPPARNVVLLQGPEASWSAVIPLLEAAGLRVTTVMNQLKAEAARRALKLQDGPTVLVGHDLGGVVLGRAGSDPKVSALVYVAAPAPDPLENSLDSAFLRIPDDAEPADQKSAVAWREKPSFYAVSQQDETISPEQQRFYAARMKAKTILLDAGHLSMASHPREIAGLILEAAGKKPPACGSAEDDGKGACAAPALPRSLAEGCKCEKGSLEDLAAP
jgi:pimeloyl-ACP methyl ester carboxylesterase